ncbi:hypothetical protein [Larkinella terrae]|uniref:Uncharacterized protein n=1 Tax=Larkinella terrae TaxID=2025311 RepID=A0A7K0EJN9_9BACT|nr:hypothetical protein [Larkinella terrae]MRS61741.1 hypothetical protein [Larkinella terrae]
MKNFYIGSLLTLASVFLIARLTEPRPLWQKVGLVLLLIALAAGAWWVITETA